MAKPAIIRNGHRIESAKLVKYLGLHLDREMRWNEQVAAALAKGQDWMRELRWLSKVLGGMAANLMRRAYMAICVPRMMYGADLFVTPQRKTEADSRSKTKGREIVKKLAGVHRQEAPAIRGAMRSTSNEALNAHANLLPMTMFVDKIRGRAITRIAKLPEAHPIHGKQQNAPPRDNRLRYKTLYTPTKSRQESWRQSKQRRRGQNGNGRAQQG